MAKRKSIKEGLNKFGQECCDGNQENAINSEDIQTSVTADTRKVYQQGEICNGTKRRTNTFTEKSKEYQLKILFEKRKKLHARMTRKYKLIDDLMYSSSNVTIVKEATDQFKIQFKQLVSFHKDYVGLPPQEVVDEEDDRFETVDEVVCTQKHKIYNLIKEVEDGNKSRSSRNSSKNLSGRSSEKSSSSSKTKSSRSSLGKISVRERGLEEKLKMEELLTEVSFTEKKHAAIFSAKKLRQTEELAKLKTKYPIFDEIENDRYLADTYD